MPLFILNKLQKLLFKLKEALRFFKLNALHSKVMLLVILSLFSKLSTSQIALRGTATVSSTVTTNTITVNKPTGTTVGDLMIVNISTFGNNVAATRTGWTPFRNINTSTVAGSLSSATLLYKVVNASDAAIASICRCLFQITSFATPCASNFCSFSRIL
jgi:hypothetical protein